MHIQHILKRDGRVAAFDRDKIAQAMAAAGQSTGELDLAGARALTDAVIASLADQPCPGVETIQNRVEEILVQAGHWRTARAYIVYREQHARLRSLRHTLVDVESAMEEYLEQRDWRVNANANQGYSLGGLILNVAGKVTANYWLSNVFAPEAGHAHREGDIHIHDLDMLSGYCAGWSLRQLLTEGFNGIPGKVEATPPRHMSAAIGQIVNFLGTLQNEWAGAQAFSSFDTYMAPFIRRDAMTYADVKQAMQELIYNLNVPSRWGTQTPFTNLTFDWTCPADLKEQIPYVGGEEMPFSYGELQAEMDMINRAYIEVMMAGDAKGRVFTFPIPTYNITPDFDWNHPNTERLFEMTARYGLPYFQNFLNSDLEPHMVRSMCCRLQLDLRELLKRGNGLFGSAEQTGSVGVVTVNCARLGYTCRGDEARLMQRLDHLLELGRDVLETKRKVVQRYIDQGLYPYTRRYLGTLRNHFSTLGVNGINEMIRNFTDDAEDITTAAGHAMAVRLLDRVRAHDRIPGTDGSPVQPGGHARRRHHLPLRPRRQEALSRHPAGRQRIATLLHELQPAAGGPYRRSVPCAGTAGNAAGQVHRRHGAAPVHERSRVVRRRLQGAGAPGAVELPPALHHDHAHVLHLPQPWLPGGTPRVLPQMRCRAARQAIGMLRPGLAPTRRACARLPLKRNLHANLDRSRRHRRFRPEAGRQPTRALRDLDPRHGLPPPRRLLQHRQTRRIQ